MITSENGQAFESIVREYSDYVHNLAYRILGRGEDARDAVQETFFKVYRKFHQYDSGQSLKNWICTIALNTSRDIYRKRKRRGTEIPFEEEPLQDKESDAKDIERRLQVEKLLGLLPVDFRIVMVLFYLEEKSISEIAQVLRVPKVLIKVRLFRARKLIIKALER